MNKVMKVYIASPCRANSNFELRKNMDYVKECIKETKRKFNLRAVALHGFLPEVLTDYIEEERNMALKWGKELLASCDGLFVCGSNLTNGMIGEIQTAIELNIPVTYFNLNLTSQLKTLRLEKYCSFYPTTSILAGYGATGGVVYA